MRFPKTNAKIKARQRCHATGPNAGGPTMSKQKRKPRNKFKPVADGNKPWNCFVIRAGKSKGTRKWGKGEFTQAVLLAIF